MCERTRRRPTGINRVPISGRRDFLRNSLSSLLLLPFFPETAFAANSIFAARVWPGPEYTRITLEAAEEPVFRSFLLTDPNRLVLDMENADVTPALFEIGSRVAAADPYVAAVRVARNRPGVVRVVFELKTAVKPSVFTLKPVGDYGHRLVIDLYPLNADPLVAMGNNAGRRGNTVETTDNGKSRTYDIDRLMTVCIDPGHGGEDPGAIGAAGTREKDVTIAISRLLKSRIDGIPNMRAVMTRDADYFIPLHMRVEKARSVSADLFVSVHADAFIKPSARGSSVFVLSENGASSAAAKWLAKRENDADLIGGVKIGATTDRVLARTLLDLSQSAQRTDSHKVAKAMLANLGEINALHSGLVESAGFAVLKAPDIPSVLVETAFISNPEEEQKLNDTGHQEKVADAIVAGIRRYFETTPAATKTRIARNV